MTEELFKSGAVYIDLPKDPTKIRVDDWIEERGKILVVPHRSINGLNFDMVEAKIVVEKMIEIIKKHDK